MTEITAEGYPVSTAGFDDKNGAVATHMAKMSKKSVSDDLASTFSSPAAWFLVVALIVTWSAVAIVMFDLMDYKNLVADLDPAYSLYCDEPCLPPGKQQVGVDKVLKEAPSLKGGFKDLSSDPMKVIDEAVEDTSTWIYGFISLLSDILSTKEYPDDDMDEGEIESQTKKKGVYHPPAKRKGEIHLPSKRKVNHFISIESQTRDNLQMREIQATHTKFWRNSAC
ncbi:triadin isoform X2 [Mobula hypostoma]|uniref:triadin isoform X2 n=1 Tax=Mobula hypostoma TaxID=723540 RepID=UPI002FC3363A